MPKQQSKFVNPLLRSSETENPQSLPIQVEKSTVMDTVPSPETTMLSPIETTTHSVTGSSLLPSTQTSTYTSVIDDDEIESVRRKRGKQAFEKTHERITLWISKRLKKRFDKLAKDEEVSKTALLDEAIADLLKKYDAEKQSAM